MALLENFKAENLPENKDKFSVQTAFLFFTLFTVMQTLHQGFLIGRTRLP